MQVERWKKLAEKNKVREEMSIIFWNVNTCLVFARRCKGNRNAQLDWFEDAFREISYSIEDGTYISDDMKRFLYNRIRRERNTSRDRLILEQQMIMNR